MDTAQHSRVIEVDWLAASPIAPHAIAFKRHLTEHQDGPLQGPGLAAAVPANAVTMRRTHRAEQLIAAGRGAGNLEAPVHSRVMCIGVVELNR